MSEENEFILVNNCTCEGHDQIYECRITGSGATVWKGIAFDCSNNEIVLLHTSSTLTELGSCNNKGIVGRLMKTAHENNTYVSQLTIKYSVIVEMVGMSISCFHDPASQNTSNLIGSSLLTITTGNTSLDLYKTNIHS